MYSLYQRCFCNKIIFDRRAIYNIELKHFICFFCYHTFRSGDYFQNSKDINKTLLYKEIVKFFNSIDHNISVELNTTSKFENLLSENSVITIKLLWIHKNTLFSHVDKNEGTTKHCVVR